jgi:phosphate starvation-inducible PhoH-like protein
LKELSYLDQLLKQGERLGFLPGDMKEKVDPYLRPLYDSLYDLFDFEKIQRMIEIGDIEIAPLAFMRGRTLKKFICNLR